MCCEGVLVLSKFGEILEKGRDRERDRKRERERVRESLVRRCMPQKVTMEKKEEVQSLRYIRTNCTPYFVPLTTLRKTYLLELPYFVL